MLINVLLKSYVHFLPPFYPIFACVDPYSEYGSGSNTDPDPDPQHCPQHCFVVLLGNKTF